MKRKLILVIVGALEAFIALSASVGGILMLAGTYQHGVLIEAGGRGQFPLEWLYNTPFSDYTIPALILAIIVGGSSLIAVVLVSSGRKEGRLASIAVGLIMAGFIVGEVVLLRQGVSWIESLYFGSGLVASGLAMYLWTVEHRVQHAQITHAGEEKNGLWLKPYTTMLLIAQDTAWHEKR